jgi:hypothetical protein
MAAAEMVGRLLQRYEFSMDVIEIRTARCIQVAVPLAGVGGDEEWSFSLTKE